MNTFINDNLIISSINNIVYVAPGTGKSVHTNRPFHGLAYFPETSAKFIFDTGKIVEHSGQCIIYLPKYSNYRVSYSQNRGSTSCYAINFDLADDMLQEAFAIPLRANTKTKTLFLTCEKTWVERRAGYYTKCMSQLYGIIYLMQTELNSSYISASQKEKLTNAVEYIHSHYLTEEISITHLASLCNMSETYFRRLFHNLYHTSPIKYINSLKIARAKELIISDMYSIQEVATLSGFYDDCYFRKIFKRETTLSPNEYRKGHYESYTDLPNHGK